MSAIIDVQQAFEGDEAILSAIPSPSELELWANAVLKYEGLTEQEVTIRFTDEVKGQLFVKGRRARNRAFHPLLPQGG